jgi:hypothetical protein
MGPDSLSLQRRGMFARVPGDSLFVQRRLAFDGDVDVELGAGRPGRSGRSVPVRSHSSRRYSSIKGHRLFQPRADRTSLTAYTIARRER